MKTNSLLTLVSLAVLATHASAAAQTEAAVVVLPTYVVNAPLYQPAEQKVNVSLNELRQQARSPIFAAIELPLVRNPLLRANLPKLAALETKALQIAKL